MVVLYPIQDVIKVHFALLRAIDLNMVSGGNGLGKIFVDFKERCVTSGAVCMCACMFEIVFRVCMQLDLDPGFQDNA
jgi:hypothetical protein